VAEVCRELGIVLIAYSPLALGLLARGQRGSPPAPAGPRGVLFRRLWPRLQPLLEGMQAIATARGAEPAAVALNWCRSHGSLPIPGLRRVDQAEAAAAALGWCLEENERQELDRLSLLCAEAGARMPANPFLSD
jgi:pyridoxine 4-dehydrogenase